MKVAPPPSRHFVSHHTRHAPDHTGTQHVGGKIVVDDETVGESREVVVD
jgi:hypothetical protein